MAQMFLFIHKSPGASLLSETSKSLRNKATSQQCWKNTDRIGLPGQLWGRSCWLWTLSSTGCAGLADDWYSQLAVGRRQRENSSQWLAGASTGSSPEDLAQGQFTVRLLYLWLTQRTQYSERVLSHGHGLLRV